LKVGNKVVLTPDYRDYGDARAGPLRPGGCGHVTRINKGTPDRLYVVEVMKPDGSKSTWAYPAEALQKFVDPAKPSSRAEEYLFEASQVLHPAQGESVFAELIDKKTKQIDPEKLKPNSVYFVRIGEGMGNVAELVDGSILKAINRVGSIAIIGGESKWTDKFLGLEQVRRETPHIIDLKPLSVRHLARIAFLDLQREGLVLQDSLVGSSSADSDPHADNWQLCVLESIVQRTYGNAKIAERNAYLAGAMIQVRTNPIGGIVLEGYDTAASIQALLFVCRVPSPVRTREFTLCGRAMGRKAVLFSSHGRSIEFCVQKTSLLRSSARTRCFE
jgi:hypothetical protein